MADRMRVTSVIGAPDCATGSTEPPGPRSWRGVRNLGPPRASHLVSRTVALALWETSNEFIRRLAQNPRLLRHAARHRALAGPALQRRRPAVHPPVRRAPWPDP